MEGDKIGVERGKKFTGILYLPVRKCVSLRKFIVVAISLTNVCFQLLS